MPSQLTSLRQLRGVLVDTCNLDPRLLLPNLTALQQLALYIATSNGQLAPALLGPLSSLAAQASTLDELAFHVCQGSIDPSAGAPRFPCLRHLHIVFNDPRCYPASLPASFPAASLVVVGCKQDFCNTAIDFFALASLPNLQHLYIISSGYTDFTGPMDALSGCSTLRWLQLCSLQDLPLASCLELAHAPQLQRLEAHGCTFDQPLSQDALGAVLGAIVRGREGLHAVVQADSLSPTPCLLPAGLIGQGHLLFGW
jgi:hypothetical protein